MPSIRPQATPSEIHEILLGIGRALAQQAARLDDAAEQNKLVSPTGGTSCVAPSTPVSHPIFRTLGR